MIVKICANKSVEEAQMCIDANADQVGGTGLTHDWKETFSRTKK